MDYEQISVAKVVIKIDMDKNEVQSCILAELIAGGGYFEAYYVLLLHT